MCSRKDGQLFNILSEYYNTDFYFPTNLGRSGIKEKSKSYFFTKYQSFCSYSCTQQFCFYSSFKHHLVAYYCFQLAQHWYCSKLSGFFLQETQHNLTVNLTTLRVWCYACTKEVFLERKLGPQAQLPSTAKPNSPVQSPSQVRTHVLVVVVIIFYIMQKELVFAEVNTFC